MADPAEPIDHVPESFQEVRAIRIVEEDVLPSVPATRDVIDSTFELNP